jgi:hypothetical protein
MPTRSRRHALDPDAIAVVGKWDPYVMGYAPGGVSRFLPTLIARSRTRRPTRGLGHGRRLDALVLRGGRAVATWSHRLAADRMTVVVTPFGTGDGSVLLELATPAFEEVAAFLDAAVDLELGATG